MLHKIFLPLMISAFLASAAASNTPKKIHAPALSADAPCAISTLRTGQDSRPSHDFLASTAIGGLADNQAIQTSFVDLRPELSLANRDTGGNFHPYMVAALVMEASSATSGTPSSCYPPLSVATTSVPAATAGASYSVSLVANGGQPPYSWSFGQSSLPKGFSISSNGDITGTPATAGTYTFKVVLSDSLKNNVMGPLSLKVIANSTTTTTPPPTQPPPTQPPPTQPPPTQPPPTQPPPTGPATGKALTACGDITKGGTYYLANDVSSVGTCFGIDANNITLNLNGHTITYGTGGGSSPTPAIENHACSYTTGHYAGGYCGKQGGGVEVYGGTIVQSPNSAAFSDVFSFGQGNFSSAPYIHDVTATFQNQGAQFYYSTYVVPGARIENNTIYDNVTNIQEPGQGILSARSAFQGQAIMIMNASNAPGMGDTISGNKIIGSPQGGIRSNDQNAVISGNDISMNATYSNDFCADMPAAGQIAENNNCHPKSGRGFHINSANDVVRNNTISVIELPQNMEYGSNGQPGCEADGTYGVQLEFDAFQGVPPTGAQITGNTITATAGDCQANGLRITSTTSAGSATISSNTVTTVNRGGAGNDYSMSLDAANGAGITLSGNTFSSQYAYVDGDWDGYQDFTIGSNTWLGTPQHTIYAGDGGCSQGVNDTLAVCPVSIQFTDTLPSTVKCNPASIATVAIGGKVTVCKSKP